MLCTAYVPYKLNSSFVIKGEGFLEQRNAFVRGINYISVPEFFIFSSYILEFVIDCTFVARKS